jgi:hypothetical protein
MIVFVTPSDLFVEDPTGLPGPMHVHLRTLVASAERTAPRLTARRRRGGRATASR